MDEGAGESERRTVKLTIKIARKVARVLLVLLGVAFLVVAAVGLLSALLMIGFGGFFSRMQGWETVTGCLLAIGIAITCFRYKPKFGGAPTEDEESVTDDGQEKL